MSSKCAYMRRYLFVIVYVLMLSQPGLAKEDVIYSGDPPIHPKATTGKITEIDGDLTIQNFDENSLLDAITSYVFTSYVWVKKVTGTVTIKNVSSIYFLEFTLLKEIGGNLVMQDNPKLKQVQFLQNNVTVKGSIEGKNCPELCSEYSYLIGVDEKYSNLFEDDCLTYNGDVNVFVGGTSIEKKRIISGALICDPTNNASDAEVNTLIIDQLKRVFRVNSLLITNDCPIRNLSIVLSSLRKVDSTVQISNCPNLKDENFDDWLYKIDMDHSKLTIKNNKNVCLVSKHAKKWISENANIPEYKACDIMEGDANLNDDETLILGTTIVKKRIYCNNTADTKFSPGALSFLSNITNVGMMEFINCSSLFDFNQMFPQGLPKVGELLVANCSNFNMTHTDILQLVNGNSSAITLINNPKICFTEIQLRDHFANSKIEQIKDCGGDQITVPTEAVDVVKLAHGPFVAFELIWLAITFFN